MKKYIIIGIIITLIIALCSILYGKEKDYNLVISDVNDKYLHFSLDDVQEICKNLQTGKEQTIFTEPTLSILKGWHDQYGIVVSLYVQGDFTINSKYSTELIKNSSWLKFGFHGNSSQARKKGMKKFYKQVMDSIKNEAIIDQCPCIHYFSANYNTCMTLKELGCKGFLTCDDWAYNPARESNYYLTAKQSELLDNNDRLFDTDNKLYFIKTDLRLEHIIQKYGGVNEALNRIIKNNSKNREIIIFSHEWNFRDFVNQADSIFRWAKESEYEFDFPANRIY